VLQSVPGAPSSVGRRAPHPAPGRTAPAPRNAGSQIDATTGRRHSWTGGGARTRAETGERFTAERGASGAHRVCTQGDEGEMSRLRSPSRGSLPREGAVRLMGKRPSDRSSTGMDPGTHVRLKCRYFMGPALTFNFDIVCT